MKNGKASYQRYKEQDKRQYDIIDLKETVGEKKVTKRKK